MKIDFKKTKEEFLKYVQTYDTNDKNIASKQEHSLRVMEISKKIAKGLNLSQEDIELATLIGLLHDIARFEQHAQYKTFKDSDSFDHGDYGKQILDKDIRKYIETEEYDEIIKKVIKNHNKYKIEDNLTEKEVLHAKIIRDADKLDIFYEAVEIFWKCQEKDIEATSITKEVKQQFKNLTLIDKSTINAKQYTIDNVISVIAFIFDINFESSFKIIKEQDYINKIINRFNIRNEKTKQELEEIRQIANEYVEKNIN